MCLTQADKVNNKAAKFVFFKRKLYKIIYSYRIMWKLIVKTDQRYRRGEIDAYFLFKQNIPLSLSLVFQCTQHTGLILENILGCKCYLFDAINCLHFCEPVIPLQECCTCSSERL